MSQSQPLLMIVDDDPVFTRILSHQLRSRGYQCRITHDSQSLRRELDEGIRPDVYILDYHLGEAHSGLELCRQIHVYLDKPVVMLSGDDNTATKVSCLNGGADQYIVKPCSLDELVARIEVVLRNSQRLQRAQDGTEHSRRASIALDENYALDWDSQSITGPAGFEVSLTEKEAALLELFFCRDSRALNRYEAFQSLYGFNMDPNNRSIDILISRLRRKLASVNSAFTIRTRRGEGYELLLKK